MYRISISKKLEHKIATYKIPPPPSEGGILFYNYRMCRITPITKKEMSRIEAKQKANETNKAQIRNNSKNLKKNSFLTIRNYP